MSRTRRAVLRGMGTAGVVGLAGCLETGRYGSFESSDPRETDRPVTGEYVPQLRAFDEAILEFMNNQRIPGGVLGVAREGNILLERGYGYRDREREVPMEPDTLVRIASLSKAFTRGAVHHLVETEAALSLTDPFFPLLDIEPLPGESVTDGIERITLGQLLDHQGGWDREEAFDPLFTQLDIALDRGWEEPPDERRLLRHMLSEPLQFRPGEYRVYSNFGYLVLGEVIEAVSGRSYQEYLERELFEPHDITDVHQGRSLPTDRPDRETWYFADRACRNVVGMEPLELVRCPDGGFHMEALSASGGHVVSVRALLSFMREYWLSGRPRTDEPQHWQFHGTLPGTFSKAVQTDGIDVVVAFNRRREDPSYLELGLRDALLDAIAAVEEWPT